MIIFNAYLDAVFLIIKRFGDSSVGIERSSCFIKLQKAGMSLKETGSSDRISITWPLSALRIAFLSKVSGSGQDKPVASIFSVSI